jgi:hypothetical protein
VLFIGKFIAPRILIIKWKVVVAVNTGEIAAFRDFDGAADGDSLRCHALVKAQAPVLIALGFHAPACYHTTRLCAKTARKENPITKARKMEKRGKILLVFLRAFLLSCFRGLVLECDELATRRL